MDNIERIGKLFSGLTCAHGQFREKADLRKSDNKVQGVAKTVEGDVTPEMWQAHLDGEYGVGVVLITDEGTCTFAAIDFDNYKEYTVKRFVTDAKKSGFPFVWCKSKSKSGGAHLYTFFAAPVEAAKVRKKLGDLARALGYPKIEIFPKQKQLEPGQVGNWINLPYFNAKYTARYAFDDDSKPIVDLEAFLDYAENKRVLPEDFDDLKVVSQETPFSDAPPCIQQMAHAGVGDGERNKSLFQFAIFAKKKYGEDWEEKVLEWNSEYFSPGLPFKEIQNTIFKSLSGDKEYGYLCKEPVCSEVCNKPLCQTREFGVIRGSGAAEGSILIPSDVTGLNESCQMIYPLVNEKFDTYYTVDKKLFRLKDGEQLVPVTKHDLRLLVEKLGGPTISLYAGKGGAVQPKPGRLKIGDAETMLAEEDVIADAFRSVSLVAHAPVLTLKGVLGNGYHRDAGGLLVLGDAELHVNRAKNGKATTHRPKALGWSGSSRPDRYLVAPRLGSLSQLSVLFDAGAGLHLLSACSMPLLPSSHTGPAGPFCSRRLPFRPGCRTRA